MKRFFVLGCMLLLMVSLVPVLAQGDTESLTVEFSVYDDGNPVLPLGEEGAWDSDEIYGVTVVVEDGLFHMFYSGSSGRPQIAAIGYATSADGINWTKYENNPVLEIDESIARGIAIYSALIIEDDTWVLYVQPETYDVYRAIAPDPTGPWTVDEDPVLEQAKYDAWDHEFGINDVVHTEDGYMLYYTSFAIGIGLATSHDGVIWTRHDNPETSGDMFSESDPILMTSWATDRWDKRISNPAICFGENGWEMFYTGGQGSGRASAIGYATSEDGVSWTRYGEALTLPAEDDVWRQSSSVVVIDDTYYLYYATWEIVSVGLWPSHGVSLATGTITRE